MTITVTPSLFLFSPHSFFSLRMKLQYHRTPLAAPPPPPAEIQDNVTVLGSLAHKKLLGHETRRPRQSRCRR